jgi:hypothetical protein
MARFRIGAPSGVIDVVFSAEQPARAASVGDCERLLFAADGRCIGYSAPAVIEIELPDRNDWTEAEQMVASGKPVRREVEIMLAVGSRDVPADICKAALAETEAPKRRGRRTSTPPSATTPFGYSTGICWPNTGSAMKGHRARKP